MLSDLFEWKNTCFPYEDCLLGRNDTWIYKDKKMQRTSKIASNSGFIPAEACGLQDDVTLLCLVSSFTGRACAVHCISLPVVVVVLKLPIS